MELWIFRGDRIYRINRIFRQEVRIFRMDRRGKVYVFAAAFL